MQRVDSLPGVTIVFSHKQDGNFFGVSSVQAWLESAGFSGHNLVHLQLVHGDFVAKVSSPTQQLITADAAVIADPSQVGGLSLVVADCIPVVLVDPERQIMALVHGGWRSLVAGIMQKTLNQMVALGATVSNIRVWIGPGIRPCCYRSQEKPQQADEQFWCSFVHRLDENEQKKSSSNIGWQVDLPGYIMYVCKKNGVPENHILNQDICTCCHLIDFFSHTRSKQTGEMSGRFLVTAFWNL